MPTQVVEVAKEVASSEGYAFDVAQPQTVERVIIREGSLNLVVEDTRATQQAIEQMVNEMAAEGAFVVSSNESSYSEGISPNIDMVIRVPAARFDESMDRLASMAVRVNNRGETAEDVTEEYVDLQARLESMEAARQRLLEIMKNADTTEDLLMAEQQLTQREAEIESIKGRLQYLTQAARLSRITISLQPYLPSQPLEPGWRPAETARQAFENLLSSLQDFGNFIIYFTIAILPWLAAIALVVYLILRWRKRRKAAKAKAEPSSD
jgi:hypothetical protein